MGQMGLPSLEINMLLDVMIWTLSGLRDRNGIDELWHNRKLFTNSILWTFLQSRNCVALFYLSTMSREECTLISVLIALFVPGKAFAWLHFFA